MVRRKELHNALMDVMTTGDREAAKQAIAKSGKPRYGTDPAHPGLLVQVLPDGTRRLGRLEGRRFVVVAPEHE